MLSMLSLLDNTSLKKVTIHTKPNLVNPLSLRAFHVPKPTPEEGKLVPKKPIPHTTAAINRTYPATQANADAIRALSGRPPKATQPRHLNATTERHKLFCLFLTRRARRKLQGGSKSLSSPRLPSGLPSNLMQPTNETSSKHTAPTTSR
jgi:hypothetical protein